MVRKFRSQIFIVLFSVALLGTAACSKDSSGGASSSVGAVSAALLNGPTSMTAGVCSALFTAQTVDSNGNASTNSLPQSAYLTVTAGGHGKVYSDSACSNQVSNFMLTSSGTGYFYVSDAVAETLNIGISIAGAASAITASDSVPVVGSSLAGIAIQGQSTEPTNSCNELAVDAVDSNGNATATTSAIAVNLAISGLSQVGIYSDSGCSAGISSLTISSGSTGTNFYIKSLSTGSESVTATATGYSPVTATIAFQVSPASLVYLASGSTISSINFGVVSTGETSSQSVTLQNTSTADTAVVSSIVLPTPGYSFNSATTCPTNASFQLPAGQTCTLGITFTPTSSGSFSGSLVSTYESLTTSAVNSASLSISGTGVQESATPPALSLVSISFNSIQVGTTSSQAMTLSNLNASQSITITGLSGFSAPFQIGSGTTCSTTYPFTLAANSSCSITIEFAPTAVGNFSGTVTYASSVGNSNSTALTGTGVSATPNAPYLSYSAINFNEVTIGYTSSEEMTLYNPNSAPISVTGVQGLGGGFALVSGGSCSLSYPFTIAANSSCTLIVEFAPTQVISYSGSITYTSSAGNTNSTALSGQGEN